MSTEFQLLVEECLQKENHLSVSELEQVKQMKTCCNDTYKSTKGQIEFLKELACREAVSKLDPENDERPKLKKKFFKNES